MKYAIDAHYRDVISAILSICNEEFEKWDDEWEEDCDFKYEEVDEYYKNNWNDLQPLYSSTSRYFRFEDTVFKLNKNQPAFTITIIEELDNLDAQWNLGDVKDIRWVMDRICQTLDRNYQYSMIEYYSDHTDDFYALQEKYEIYIPPTLTR